MILKFKKRSNTRGIWATEFSQLGEYENRKKKQMTNRKPMIACDASYAQGFIFVSKFLFLKYSTISLFVILDKVLLNFSLC